MATHAARKDARTPLADSWHGVLLIEDQDDQHTIKPDKHSNVQQSNKGDNQSCKERSDDGR